MDLYKDVVNDPASCSDAVIMAAIVEKYGTS